MNERSTLIKESWITQKFNDYIWITLHQFGVFEGIDKPDQIEFFDLKNDKYILINRHEKTFNKVLNKKVEITRTFGAMRDELRAYLREEGNYNHKMIENILNFWDNIEFNPIFLIFNTREEFEEAARANQKMYLYFGIF
ncbi:MAG: hypothetical protein GY870_20625 [archaeon]|nr:hypothetical protein [archaeon]